MKNIYTFICLSAILFVACSSKKVEDNTQKPQDTVKQADTNTRNIPVVNDSAKKITKNTDSTQKEVVSAPKEAQTTSVKSTAKNAKIKVAKGTCPICKKKDMVIPVLYGRPGRELQEKEKAGTVKLAGCVYGKGMPRFHCKRDNKGFI